MTPIAALERLQTVAGGEWAEDLIRSWDHWLDLPRRVGDRLAPIIGAPAGSVVVHDSTTVNLYQLVHAALALAGDGALAVDGRDFPTDRYVVAGIAAGHRARRAHLARRPRRGRRRRALGRRLPHGRAHRHRAAETTRARRRARSPSGTCPMPPARSRSTSSPSDVDLAVGCTYKFLHGGPGAPAYAYVRPGLVVEQPMWGWFAQAAQFEMGDAYEPHPTSAGCCSARRASSAWPPPRSASATSPTPAWPRSPPRAGPSPRSAYGSATSSGSTRRRRATRRCRGPHVAVRVGDADDVHAALTQRGVITDVRRPDVIRLGCAALTTRFTDVWDGVHAVRDAC